MAEKKQAYPQRVAPVLKDGTTKYIKSTDLADLAKYNQAQTPAPKPTVQSLTSPGRFQVDTSNGILSSRGAGPEGGSGGGGGWEGPPVEGRVQTALRQALLPQAQAPAPAAQPYRQEEGARVMSAPRGRVAAAVAQNLLSDVNGGGYSAGVLATRERQRAMQQADSLQLPPAVRAAVQDQILAGNYKAPQVAASLAAQLPAGADSSSGKVQEYLRQQLLGGDVAQAHQAKKAQDAAAYHAAAQANLAQAQQGGGYRGSSGYLGMAGVGTGSVNDKEIAMGPGLQAMGLQNGAPLGKVQEALRQALMGGSAKDLQAKAAAGNPMAAQALAQVQERDRKHQAKLDQEARDRKAADDWLEYQRKYELEMNKQKLDNEGRAVGQGQGRGRGGAGGGRDYQEHDKNEAYRDYVRQQGALGQALSKPEWERQYWEGYSPGMLGQAEQFGWNALSGIGNVLGAPIHAMQNMQPQQPGSGVPMTAPTSLGPPGMRPPAPVAQPPASPQATPIPNYLVHPPPGLQPQAWNAALGHLADLTPQERARFDAKPPAEQQRLLAQSAGM